jgi:hypothetical protein
MAQMAGARGMGMNMPMGAMNVGMPMGLQMAGQAGNAVIFKNHKKKCSNQCSFWYVDIK